MHKVGTSANDEKARRGPNSGERGRQKVDQLRRETNRGGTERRKAGRNETYEALT